MTSRRNATTRKGIMMYPGFDSKELGIEIWLELLWFIDIRSCRNFTEVCQRMRIFYRRGGFSTAQEVQTFFKNKTELACFAEWQTQLDNMRRARARVQTAATAIRKAEAETRTVREESKPE